MKLYFQQLKIYETAVLYITERTDDLNKEIFHNCISFSLTNDQARELSGDDFIQFFSGLRKNCQQQLKNSGKQIGMIYYLWFDEMAGQLRLNFINQNHLKLPFGCELEIVHNEREILLLFQNSGYLQGVPWSDLNDEDKPDLKDIDNPVGSPLKVFKEEIFSD